MRADLVRDGPHILAGGTTGSGKSELLLAMIAGLAVEQPPWAVNFLLIDYKGGAAFRHVVSLPHVVGVVTDLDPYLVRRGSTSLDAELRRREHLLSTSRSADISRHNASVDEELQLARLIIVVDELAALRAEQPAFVDSLVAVAQRGRSLGVHVILATQRPAGAVTQNIRANTNIRVAMRTSDEADSQDLVEVPDAAWLPSALPGIGLFRIGLAPPIRFRAALTSGRPAYALADSEASEVVPLRWKDLGHAPERSTALWDGPTELEDVVSSATQLAASLPRAQAIHVPWLPPLALVYPLPQPGEEADTTSAYEVPYAVADIPAEQAQRWQRLDLREPTHQLIVGSPGSGRTQALLTIAASAAARLSVDELFMYGIDAGHRGLSPLADLPHCGGVLRADQTELVVRLLARLTAMLRERQRRDYRLPHDSTAQHAPVASQPLILLLVDEFELLLSSAGRRDEQGLIDEVGLLLREGGAVGIHVVMTGSAEFLTASPTRQLGAFVSETVVLSVTELQSTLLLGSRLAGPDASAPGRGIHLKTGRLLQIAIQPGGPTSRDQQASMTELGERLARSAANANSRGRPFVVSDLETASDRFHVGDAHGKPVGRDDVLAWLRDRHASGTSVALLGQRRAGKTWVISELSRRLTEEGTATVRQLVIPQPSETVDTPDGLARILDRGMRSASTPADDLLDAVVASAGTPQRFAFLLDEVGRLTSYHPAAVSWLRDLGQSGAWLLYSGTEKDWHLVRRWALRAPGSSFGNDVNAHLLGPLPRQIAASFLIGTAANLGVSLPASPLVEWVFQSVGTWPFYLQVVGDALVRSAQRGVLPESFSVDAVAQMVEVSLLDEWTQHFQARWAEIGAAGRGALIQGVRNPADVLAPEQRVDLRDVGLLRAGDIWLEDPPFYAWVRRNVESLSDDEVAR